MRREISGGSAHPSGRRLPLPVDRDPLHRPERISPLPPRTCIQGRGLLMRKRTIVQRTDRDGVAGLIPSQNGGSDRATDRFASPEAMSQHALRPRLRIADLDPGVVCQVRLTLRRQRARCEGVCEHLARHWVISTRNPMACAASSLARSSSFGIAVLRVFATRQGDTGQGRKANGIHEQTLRR
jgi:hypothetical protein